MTATVVAQLDLFGPERCETLGLADARAWCLRLARSHGENFSVLSSLVPRGLRDDYAALYAFCRWADDLGDEMGDAERSLALLNWWREELRRCFEGRPRHPVFVALQPTLERHSLPMEPFDDLIAAFEQDQTVTRYETWAQLLDYCRRSANPVGRLVLMIAGEPRTNDLFSRSDATCTALQLTNHWQDARRDLLERDRIYIPRELNGIADFEQRFLASARQGYAVDRTFLAESRRVVAECVRRTWPLFERGLGLLDRIDSKTRPMVGLFSAGGCHVLRQIEMWNHETVLHRPTLGMPTKLWLVARAWMSAKLGSRGAR